MLERAKAVTRDVGWARVEYARYADDLVIVVDGYRRHAWWLTAVDRRLREELAKLDLRRNEAKSRIVDLRDGLPPSRPLARRSRRPSPPRAAPPPSEETLATRPASPS